MPPGLIHELSLIVAVAAGLLAMVFFVLGGGKTSHAYAEARRYVPRAVDDLRMRLEIEYLMRLHGTPEPLQREYETGKRQSLYSIYAAIVAGLAVAVFWYV